jgi:hypothetical protein
MYIYVTNKRYYIHLIHKVHYIHLCDSIFITHTLYIFIYLYGVVIQKVTL